MGWTGQIASQLGDNVVRHILGPNSWSGGANMETYISPERKDSTTSDAMRLVCHHMHAKLFVASRGRIMAKI